MSRTTPIALLMLAASAVSIPACGDPCLPTFLADTSFVAPAEECVDEASTSTTAEDDTDSASSDAITSTTDEASTTTGGNDPNPNPLTCVAAPKPGEFWGPCISGETCFEGACEADAASSVCVPGCTEDPCNIGVCFPGVCNDASQCVAPCDDASDCAPGMACNSLGHCAWPA